MPSIKNYAAAYAALLLFAGTVVMFFTFTGQTQTTPARTPFQRTLNIDIPTKPAPSPPVAPPTFSANYSASYTVPAGKRLVIENVTGQADFPAPVLSSTYYCWPPATYKLKTTVAGNTSFHVLPMDQVGDPTMPPGTRLNLAGLVQEPPTSEAQCGVWHVLWETSRQVRLYADPGTTVTFQLTRNHFPADASNEKGPNWNGFYYCGAKANITISGYLVDASSGALSPADGSFKGE